MQQFIISLANAATIAVALLVPSLAWAQPQPDPGAVGEVGLAFTVGGGVAIGLAHSLGMLIYRRRHQLLAIDTRAEVISVLGFAVPVAGLAYFALPGELDLVPKLLAAVTVAVFTTLRTNSGPLGEAPPAPPE